MSNVLSRVREARMQLKSNGVHGNTEIVEDLFKEAQTIIAEMNTAKLAALKQVEKPFMERLEEIDKELALFITLAN